MALLFLRHKERRCEQSRAHRQMQSGTYHYLRSHLSRRILYVENHSGMSASARRKHSNDSLTNEDRRGPSGTLAYKCIRVQDLEH